MPGHVAGHRREAPVVSRMHPRDFRFAPDEPKTTRVRAQYNCRGLAAPVPLQAECCDVSSTLPHQYRLCTGQVDDRGRLHTARAGVEHEID